MKKFAYSWLLLVMSGAAVGAVPLVELAECARCPMRMRLSADGKSATINLARLKDDNPDVETLDRRIRNLKARAEKLLNPIKPSADPKLRPLMGWSSWNTFGVDISEDIILETARAMSTNGLKASGYVYVNIDDGFFWGHGADGVLRFHPRRFPNGMKSTVDGIHALGLKAGIYSDAGADTCGSMWAGSGSEGKDNGGLGGGLYGHDAEDCKLLFNDLGFDFIKVDYCGGNKLGLKEKERYTEIANAIKATGRNDVRLNICRWAFPGTWAADIAESWRTTADIRANWKSVKKLIAENLYLAAYARAGHYNDMDMLEVGMLKGRFKSVFGEKHGDFGLTPDEEQTHFGIWCLMSSPLLIGCDVRAIPEDSKALLTNPYLLAMNQNDLGVGAYVARREGDAYILVKDAENRFGQARYVALYNARDVEHVFTVSAGELDLAGRIEVLDLVKRGDPGPFEGKIAVRVRPHAAKFFRFDAERRLDRRVYEAESAYLTSFHRLRDPEETQVAHVAPLDGASGGMVVRCLGKSGTNDLVWKDVKVSRTGFYDLRLFYSTSEERMLFVQIDTQTPVEVRAPASSRGEVLISCPMTEGIHAIRLFNDVAWAPSIDKVELSLRSTVARLTTLWDKKVARDGRIAKSIDFIEQKGKK